MQFSSPPSRLNVVILSLAYGGVLICLLLLLAQSIRAGGSSWQQADWLINYAAGPIRRGVSGHLILGLSDALGVHPLTLLGGLQGALVGVLLGGVGYAFYAIGLPDRALVLAISPAFLPFWAYDYLGAMRKDMLALAAFLPLLMTGRGADLRAVTSLLVLSVAVLFHEANGFIAPFLAVALWGALPRRQIAYGAAALGIGALGFAIALVLPSLSDPAPICAELLERGFSESFCGGSIRWLEFDLARVLKENSARIRVFGVPYSIALSYALALMPVAVALWFAPRWTLGAAIASALLFVPLYVVALDWGRWVFLHIACLTLIVLTLARHGQTPWLYAPLPRRWFAFFLAASTMWSMSFYTGETKGGLIASLAAMF